LIDNERENCSQWRRCRRGAESKIGPQPLPRSDKIAGDTVWPAVPPSRATALVKGLGAVGVPVVTPAGRHRRDKARFRRPRPARPDRAARQRGRAHASGLDVLTALRPRHVKTRAPAKHFLHGAAAEPGRAEHAFPAHSRPVLARPSLYCAKISCHGADLLIWGAVSPLAGTR
jgi:hypothetical protein